MSERWVLITTFDITTGFPVGQRRPLLVYRNMRGAQAFRNTTDAHVMVVFHFQNMFVTQLGYVSFDMLGRREGVVLMLLTEGFGRTEDLHLVNDSREDKEKQYTQVRIFLFIPLLIAVLLLAVGATTARLMYPKRHIVLRVPVNSVQLMSCARAREKGGRETTFGHSQAKLQMSIALSM